MHFSKPLSDLVMRSAAAATDKTRLLLCGSNNTAVIITLGGAPLTTHMLVEVCNYKHFCFQDKQEPYQLKILTHIHTGTCISGVVIGIDI